MVRLQREATTELRLQKQTGVTMPRNQISPLIFALAVSFAGCGRAAEAARVELAQMNVPYTETAYIESARQGDTATLTLFLKAGMSPEAKTYDGQSALLVATLANQADAVKLLLAKGAGPNAQDKHGGTALMTAAWKGNKEIIEALLANGADVNKQANNGMTALMFAAWENHLEISKALLEKGAEFGLKDKNGWTALMRADFKGHTEIANILRESQRRKER
jgi:ankyrin repeat protein